MSFIERQAKLYAIAPWNPEPWGAYAKEVREHWEGMAKDGLRITLVDSALSYLDVQQLRRDVDLGNPIRVWSGGNFAPTHPLAASTGIRDVNGKYLKHYHLSRAVHDVQAHNDIGYSFSSMDELRGALATKRYFTPLAQSAQWTDDVAMGCYYAHYGTWPTVQKPVIVEPDWEGLEGYLNGPGRAHR